MKKILLTILTFFVALPVFANVDQSGVRLKELARVVGVRDNSLVGYGLVAGLSGTGDSIRSRTTIQSIANTLRNLGLTIDAKDIASRNVAAVIVSATLPPFSLSGDKLDVNVTSLGDAKSLLGGTLLLTHLKAANGKIYALAQGPLSVGGFKYDLNGNVVQKNHTTAGNIPNGATVEKGTKTTIVNENGEIVMKLHSPDFTTVTRVKSKINSQFGTGVARSLDAGRIAIQVPEKFRSDEVAFLMRLESLRITPDLTAKVVINERTGTVVSGGEVTISDVTISHGDLKLSITTDFIVSQPFLVRQTESNVRTQVVPDTSINVSENQPISLSLKGQTSVSDLVQMLKKVRTSSRDMITILQTIKRAGALHAELVIQ